MAVRSKVGASAWMLAAIAAIVIAAILTQHALVNGVARFLADLWVSTVAVVLKLFASIFGAH